MVELEKVETANDVGELRHLITLHHEYTGSPVAQRVLDEWEALAPRFVKVFPTDYKRVLAELARQETEVAEGRALAPHHDHPDSTGGEGYVITESEDDTEVEVRADG